MPTSVLVSSSVRPELPHSFRRSIQTTFKNGAAWLASLPTLVANCEERWAITLREPFPLSYSFVALAVMTDGSEVVLHRLLPVSRPPAAFHDFSAFEELVTAAGDLDPRAELMVLLGGEAGLRLGEMVALEWDDVDLARHQLSVCRNVWKGQVSTPKGGRVRHGPLTNRLAAALQRHRHRRGPRVLYQDDGTPFTEKALQTLVRRSAIRAKVTPTGVHVLRHTFCSHLAMKGAAPTAIQELAGHTDLSTTLRYMHLTPAALDGAIALLNDRHDGDIVETGDRHMTNPND